MTEINFDRAQVACLYEHINSNGVWQEKDQPAWQFLTPDPKAAWEYINKIAVEAGKRVDRRNIRFVWRGVTTEPMRVSNLAEAQELSDAIYTANIINESTLLDQLIDELGVVIDRWRR